MNIVLYKDNTYKIFKKSSKIMRKLDNAKYIILDISTPLKGPVHTLIKTKNLYDSIIDYNIDIYVVYAAIDCPASDASTFNYRMITDNINSRYNIYPLIKQMIDFNTYKYNMYIIDSEISIENISITINDSEIIEINEYISDDEMEKEFKKLKLKTDVDSSLNGKHIILRDNKWNISENIPKHFDYILYNMGSNESLYLLNETQFKCFSSVEKLSINMFGRYQYGSELYKIYDSENFEEVDNYIDINRVDALLDTCLYFPQYIELEKAVYESRMALKIDIETSYRSYSLKITEKEFNRYPIKLFEILNKILYI